MNTATPTSRAGRREWLGLGVLALACMLATMDLTVLFLALPKISADLHPSSTEMLWITDSALRSTGSTWGTPRFALETAAAVA